MNVRMKDIKKNQKARTKVNTSKINETIRKEGKNQRMKKRMNMMNERRTEGKKKENRKKRF
jgi:hypothetical protein